MRILLLWVAFSFMLITVDAQTPLKMRDTTLPDPQTFAMIVGISNYRYVRPLKYAHRDAELFRDYLRSPAGGNVKNDNIFCLLNEEAINSTFWAKGFQWLKAKQLRQGDRLFIYLAGHGDAIDGDQYFFLTYDCNPGGDKNNYLAGGAIQLFNLKKKIAAESTRGVEVFLVMDACRSNELPGGPEGMSFLNTAVSEKQAGEVIMLATAAGQESLEDPSIGNGHGLFTWYLIDGLSGIADTDGGADNKVTLKEIQSYINSQVPVIAEQRFKRKQAPYFCCPEFDNKVIGSVDDDFLKNWLKKKKNNRGGGNSFNGDDLPVHDPRFAADTTLIQTYNRFYAAVKNKRWTGASSAEDYLRQLDTKFPGNPYTLDARSTLAVEYINAAQEKVNAYLGCTGGAPSQKEKQQLFTLGMNMEKAIQLVSEDEPEFGRSLLGRMYFLKSSGEFSTATEAIQYAHNGLAVEPGSAYLENQLALLHLSAGNRDSARYYAEKAVRTAPNWRCAALTLSRTREPQKDLPKTDSTGKSTSPKRRPQFGMLLGPGISRPGFKFTPQSNDTIRAMSMSGAFKLDLGFIMQLPVGNRVHFRPSLQMTIESFKVNYSGQNVVGAPFSESLKVDNAAFGVQLPFVFHFSQKTVSPYIMAGPSFHMLIQSKERARELFPLKKVDFTGDAGLGLDIRIKNTSIVLSTELKYTRGLTDPLDRTDTNLGRAISNYNRQQFALTFYMRDYLAKKKK